LRDDIEVNSNINEVSNPLLPRKAAYEVSTLNWPFREKPRGSSLKGRKVDLVALE
jgi:hypothetical protein